MSAGLTLDGYRTRRLLRSSGVGQVWLATRERDQLPVVAKAFAVEGNDALAARVRHEFELISGLDVPGVVRALSLERSGCDLVLVLEDYGGLNLREYANGRPLPLDEFFAIAAATAEILAEVHQRRVIHRDLKPTNILVDPETGRVAIADFGISVLLESEHASGHDAAIIEGTLPYMAPEQTGRSAREVDFRSDLYALGATFYELLTGRPPFLAETPRELIHAHFARRPPAPQQLRPELPTALSNLVLKLLEKAPERRYQSARGLALDLRRMQQTIASGNACEEFELARDDSSTKLLLPHELYGRERERERLRAAFRRSAVGAPVLVGIVGPPGIGKSVLLDELLEPVNERNGILARGKFDEQVSHPFSAIVAAIGSAIDQLLTESPESLRHWQTRLRLALAGCTPQFTALIPRLSVLLGDDEHQPAEPGAAPAETRTQVLLAFARLLGEFARPEHPLALVLDDLQWADSASIGLIEKLVGDDRLALLIVVTSRERPGDSSDPTSTLFRRLRARGHRPELIELAPLDRDQLTQMIADTLGQPVERVAPLAQIVARKTGSNPLFARQLLLMLAELGLLEHAAEGWCWDSAELERAGLPDDVLEMMTAKIARLDPAQQQLIGVASVFGQRFDPLLLLRIGGADTSITTLQQLVDEGLLVPLGRRSYAFAHDRIRAAAYASLEHEQRRKLHLAVGELLREQLERSEQGSVFEVVDHLNRGYRLTTTERPIEASSSGTGDWPGGWPANETSRDGNSRLWEFARDQLAVLARSNLEAGSLALHRGAPGPALAYLRIANRLFGELGYFVSTSLIERESCIDARGWSSSRTLRFEARLALAQAATLTNEHREADLVFSVLIHRRLPPELLARVAVARILQLILSERAEQVIDYGKQVLRELDVHVPNQVTSVHVLATLPRLAWLARPEAVARCGRLEPIRDRRARAAVDVLQALESIASILHAPTYVVLVDRHAELIARHGDHPSAPQVFTAIAMILANGLSRRRQALELADHCVALARAGGSLSHRVVQGRLFVRMWFDNLLDLADAEQGVAEQAHAAGDIEVAEYAWAMRLELAFYGGLHLRSLVGWIEAWERWAAQWGTAALTSAGRPLAKACARLLDGPVPEPGDLDPIALQHTVGRGLGALNTWVGQLLAAMVLVVFGRWREADAVLQALGDKLERATPGMWFSFMVPLFSGLTAAALASDPSSPWRARRRHRRQLARRRRELIRKVAHGANFAHGELLLRAEARRLRGDFVGAAKLYVAARTRAAEQRNPWFEALVCERMAAIAIERGIDRFGLTALHDARAYYLRWGAFAKVAALDEQWPQLRPTVPSRVDELDSSARHANALANSSSGSTSRAIDNATLLEASQAIAEDLELDEVIARVLRLAVENVGAERGALLLAHDGKLALAAEYRDEGEHAEPCSPPRPLAELGEQLPIQLLRWVARTAEPVVHDGSHTDVRFVGDPYLMQRERSILCAPIIKRGELLGLIYLENQLSGASFSAARLETLGLLAAQAGNALDNARLYADLRQSESRWRSLVEQLPDYVAIAEPDGSLSPISSTLGIHNRVPDLDADPGELGHALQYVFETGGRCELELRDDPAEVYFVVRIGPLAVNGKVERALIVATDVSERRRAEAARQRFEAQLRQQQRLEAIGTLASGVAHEINNPIQGIMNYAELIDGSAAADPFIRELAGEITHEGQRVTTIVRNLLAFARQDRGLDEHLQPTRVSELVEQTLSLIRSVLRKDTIDLRVDVPETLPEVMCRSQQIQQVVLNLVTNARDALNGRYRGEHPNKRIEITAELVQRDEQDWVRLSVSDCGGGVPEHVVGRIFDPFFTTKGRDRGTGLGLALSHGIVTEHGGSLYLDNFPGEGARFSIDLRCFPAPQIYEPALG